MQRQILFSAADLRFAQKNSDCVVFDCRFDLKNPDSGLRAYLESHIPGAVYAHLDNDLSSPATNTSGRHPLPEADKFSEFLARSGWCPGKSLIVYDDAGGVIAARLWWLMKYFGYDCAAILDGGMGAWGEAGFEFESGYAHTTAAPVTNLEPNEELVLSTADIIKGLRRHEIILADARASERFAGEFEPIDRVAGHIPGAFNLPVSQNLTASEKLKPVDEISRVFQTLRADHDAKDLVHMCGSGVTACFNIFASELAGINAPKLYVGSWSEWIQDPARPVR